MEAEKMEKLLHQISRLVLWGSKEELLTAQKMIRQALETNPGLLIESELRGYAEAVGKALMALESRRRR